MSDRQTGTNAGDSAPGADDGRATGRRPRHFSRPGGRARVWLWIALSLVVLAAIFIAKPRGSREEGEFIGPAATQSEIEASTVPGAATPPPAPPR